MIISLSILSAPLLTLADTIKKYVDYGIDRIHLDVMDGHYVPRIAFGHDWVRAIKDNFPHVAVDAHLMVHPTHTSHYDLFMHAGTQRLWLHYPTVDPTIHHHTQWVLCLGENIDILPKHTTDILLMAVQPGAGGQHFNPSLFTTIAHIKKEYPHIWIAVDGGVCADNICALKKAGVHEVIMGQGLLQAKEPHKLIRAIHEN